jgi:hypothetical protein
VSCGHLSSLPCLPQPKTNTRRCLRKIFHGHEHERGIKLGYLHTEQQHDPGNFGSRVMEGVWAQERANSQYASSGSKPK